MKSILVLLSFLTSSCLWAQDYSKETQEAKDLRTHNAIRVSYNYCTVGTLTCRTLVLLKDTATDRTVSEFYDNFMSSERAVAATGYFIQNTDGTYHAFLDQTFDGQINVDMAYPENSNVVVTFDPDYFPTIHNMTLKRLGTTRHVIADMKYTSEYATIIGFEYDSADANYKQPVRTIYRRQHGKAK